MLNRLTNMVDAVGTTTYTWDSVGQVLSETGPWADDTVTYTYANRLRTSMSVEAPNSSPWVQSYTYDSARRFATITSPAGTFTYHFQSPISYLPSSVSLPGGAYATNSYDSCARLLLTALTNSGGTGLDYWFYSYNQANQRTNVARLDGSYVAYSYDAAGQLIGAHATEADGLTARKNEQFGYKYDPAANLAWRTNNALWEAFNVNNLNELTTETNAGTLTVAGTTTSTATNVTVNGLTASRYGDYTFAKDGFAVTNGNNTFTAIAQDSYGRQDTNSVICNLPSAISFAYDLNGNMITNGNQALAYEDENQLTSITVSNSWRSEFVYDGKMRRRIRREYTWSGASWLLTNTVYYIYDRNLVIQERDANNLPADSYTRGLDLSGTLQGAGGIGGLLARTDHHLLAVHEPSAHAYYHADGNGNVTTLLYANGFLAAKYLYEPFGERLSPSGSLANINPYRFSSKEYHERTGMYYYGARFYGPAMQRWLNRDPVAEQGGINLFAMLGNDPVSGIDPWGFGEWTFLIQRGDGVVFPGPLVNVSYQIDKNQAKCCQEYTINRYAKPFYFGALIPGWWRDDTSIESTIPGNQYSPAYSIDEPHQRFPFAGWIVPLVIEFRWDVVCTSGENAGQVVATATQTIVIFGNTASWVGHCPDCLIFTEGDGLSELP